MYKGWIILQGWILIKGLINIILVGFTSFLSLLIYCYLFQSAIRVLNIDKLINYTRGIHEISISLS